MSLSTSSFEYCTTLLNQTSYSCVLETSDKTTHTCTSIVLVILGLRRNAATLKFTDCSLTEDSAPIKECLFQCANTVTLPSPPLCGCGPYTIQGRVRQSVFPLFAVAEDGKKWEQICLATTVRVLRTVKSASLWIVSCYHGNCWCRSWGNFCHWLRYSCWRANEAVY